MTKEKRKEYSKTYLKNHPKERKETCKKYRLIHREEILKKHKKYNLLHKEEIKQKSKEFRKNHKKEIQTYRDNNKEKFKKYCEENVEKRKECQKEYYQKNKIQINKDRKNRYITNIQFKLNILLRGRFYKALKRYQKSGSAVRDLGCSIPELKIYLENQFKEGMSWDNWMYSGWHIDHIVPLVSFDLTNREELLKAVHYTNLQPMWGEENMKKGSKLLDNIQQI